MPSTLHHGGLVPAPNQPESNGHIPFQEEGAPEAPALSLRDFIDILRRRKLVALNVFVLVVALGFVVTLMTKPVYRTGAKLLVEGRANTFSVGNNSDDPFSSVFQTKPARDVDTQVEILRSSLVLDRVFKQAGISPNSVDLDVQRVDRTDVIDLTATSTSRDAADKFIKALPEVYENDQRNDRLREVNQSLNFARRTLAQQNGKLLSTERALSDFKTHSKVVNTGDEATDAISATAKGRSDLADASLNNDKLQAQLDSLTSERSGLSRFVDMPVTTTNPQVQILNDQLDALNSERNQKLFLYKPSDDVIRQVDLQIRGLRARIARTPSTITNTTRALNPAVPELDAKVSEARTALRASQRTLAPLRSQVEAQASNLSRFNNIQRQQARLERDLETSSGAVKTLTQNVMQLTLRQTALEAAGAPVVTMQTGGPATQIAPRLSRNLLAALFLGALLACGAALLQESLDDHIRDEDEARRLLGTSVLGYFPMMPNKGERPILHLENPDKGLLESFRVLRSNVHFALVNSPGQKILVTSAVPGEGKSYVASNLAIAMALNGRTVILVDTDLHRPRQHEVFDVPRYPGLTDALVGNAKLRDCVKEVGVPGLRLITAGVTPPNPAELLNSAVMDAVIDRLGKGADVVIFDSPPLLATADSQVLSSKVDGVIFVMQLGRVPRSATQRSFELLRQARARIIGMVFNQIEKHEAKGHGNYSYSDYEGEGDDAPVPTLLPKMTPDSAGALLTSARRFRPNRKGSTTENGANGHENGNGHGSISIDPNIHDDNGAA